MSPYRQPPPGWSKSDDSPLPGSAEFVRQVILRSDARIAEARVHVDTLQGSVDFTVITHAWVPSFALWEVHESASIACRESMPMAVPFAVKVERP